MPDRLPVIAAIPNYNMGHHLRLLLPQVLRQGYDRVYVFDDGSTDDSAEVVAGFGADVRLVRSARNRGSTGNRNQVIEHVGDGELIHFIDADMDLGTEHVAAVARELAARYAERGVGAIGGLVSRIDGTQEPYNFGPAFSLKTHLTAVPPLLDRMRARPRVARAVRALTAPVAADYPDVLHEPAPAPAYWLHEGNLLVFSDIFRAIGGYDVRMRNHEAQDLAIRLEKRGVKRQFDPSIEVIHHYIDVRGGTRRREQYDALRYLLRKHGAASYLTGSYR